MREPLAVVLDTDVWSARHVPARRRDARVPRWQRALEGAEAVIATQTRAEVLSGVQAADWGEAKKHAVHVQVRRTQTLAVDVELVEVYAKLTAALRRAGHALHDKQHTGNRWIAASAIHYGLPLLSGDGIYRKAPGLLLFDEEVAP